MDNQELSEFLKKAKKSTYASESAPKVASSRVESKDYEYAEGDWLYHDTYFGGVSFIGEEVAYKAGKPVWGMNYNGFVVGKNVTEEDIDRSLRPALQVFNDEIIPVRGPEEFINENYKYTNNLKGDLSCFEGREEIVKAGQVIYYAVYHGGYIK